MFLTHFKFTSQPFAERVSADGLWLDDRTRQALARLNYTAENATAALITGPSGVGKSAVLKRFLHELSGPQWEPVYLHLTHLPAAGLLKMLVAKLGEVPRRGKERLSATTDLEAAAAEAEVVFIVVPTPSEPHGGFSIRHVLSACEAIGRNPGAVGPIRITMIIGLALIESLVIYALIIAFLILA